MKRAFESNCPRIICQSQNISLCTNMCYLVFVYHFLFFHLFDCNYFICFPVSTYSHFSKSSSSNNLSGNEIPDRYFCPLKSIIFRLFMQNLLLYQLFFLVRKFHLVHLFGKFVPCFFSFALFEFCLCVFAFDICFGTCCLFSSAATCSRILWRSSSSSCSTWQCWWWRRFRRRTLYSSGCTCMLLNILHLFLYFDSNSPIVC